jgi:hypothetical protein
VREVDKEDDIDSIDSLIFPCGFLFSCGISMKMSGTLRTEDGGKH